MPLLPGDPSDNGSRSTWHLQMTAHWLGIAERERDQARPVRMRHFP